MDDVFFYYFESVLYKLLVLAFSWDLLVTRKIQYNTSLIL